MDLRQRFRRKHPDFPLLELTEPRRVEDHLRGLGWLEEGETFLGCSRAGEGNMNLTLRVHTDRRTLIVKQSRPWVEKYDQIAAPLDRALVEQAFYERITEIPEVASRMPRLLGADADSRCLALEDLGEDSEDLSTLYADGELSLDEARSLGAYLAALHQGTRVELGKAVDEVLLNRAMRGLNHEHLFVIPLSPGNGLDLEPHEAGLGAAAAVLQADPAVAQRAAELGQRYLADGPCLVHGDFFPGSWLRTAKSGVRVIDPEFCHYGDPELDLGVATAHLVVAGQSRDLVWALLETAGVAQRDESLVGRYSGIEVIRRVMGVAQLPRARAAGRRAGWAWAS